MFEVELYIVDGAIYAAAIPKGVRVVIRDYDVPDDWEGIHEDENGPYQEIVFPSVVSPAPKGV